MTDQTEAEVIANQAVELQTANVELLQQAKQVQEQLDQMWKNVEQEMTDNDIKSIKGSWGSITLAERTTFVIDDDQLAPEFWKKVPDTKKIGETYKLEGEAPAGAVPRSSRYIIKRIK